MRWLPKTPEIGPLAGQTKSSANHEAAVSWLRAASFRLLSRLMRGYSDFGMMTVFCGRPVTFWMAYLRLRIPSSACGGQS